MPEPTSPPVPRELTWAHTDSRGIGNGIAASATRALTRGWQNDQASTADLRSLVLNSFLQTSKLGATPPSSSQGIITIRPNPSARTDFRDAQDALMLAVYALLARNPASDYTLDANAHFETEDGGAATNTTETGFPWLGAIAIVAVVGAVAGVVTDWLEQQNQIEATKLATDANAQKLAATLAAANQLVESHLEREDSANSTIPWEPAELDLIASLKADTKTLAEWKAPELKSGPIAGGVGEVLGGTGAAITHVGQGVENAGTAVGFGGGAVLALLAALWVWNESPARARRAA